MKSFGVTLVLTLLAAALAHAFPHGHPHTLRPPCDSPDVEAAAFEGLNFINHQHSHGYKYTLEQIDDVKIIQKPTGEETYLLEVDLRETACHVLDSTPVANCSLRPVHEMHIEADCDLALTKAGGVLSVTAFKCKTKPDSRECVGCVDLQPLNSTFALKIIQPAIAQINNRSADNPDQARFVATEVGRLSSQVVSGGPKIFAEFIIAETNCTVDDADDDCVLLNQTVGRKGFCSASGQSDSVDVNCRLFETGAHHHHIHHQIHHHSQGTGSKHHPLTALHDPGTTGLLSESKESAEVPKVKRETVGIPQDPLGTPAVPPVPVCPGRKRI